MITSKEEAINATKTIASALDGFSVQGGAACFRVGNAYMACMEMLDFLQALPEPEVEDEPPEDKPEKED